jgi:hypothetical protein
MLPERDKQHVADGGSFLLLDHRFRGEDDARIGAVRQAEPFVQPRAEVRLERGDGDRALAVA